MLITQWRIVGPFISSQSAPLSYDYLRGFGTSESTISARALRDMTRSHYRGSGELPRSFVNKVITSDTPFVSLASTLSSDEDLVAYATCELYAEESTRVTLVAGSDDGVRIWLNNKLVVNTADDTDRRLRKYHHMVLLRVDRGSNLLLVKVDQKKTYPQLWSFAVALQKPHYALRMAKLNAVSKILEQHTYKPGEPLRLCHDLYEPADVESIILLEEQTGTAVRRVIRPASATALDALVADVREGSYRCRLAISGETFEESIYVGNALQPLADYRRSRLTQQRAGDQVGMDVSALVTRYEHLLSREHYKPADVVWQKKIVFLAGEMERILSSLARGSQAYRGRPGLHLRGYRSEIDGAIQYYMIFVPRRYTGAPIPLVVHVHPTMSIHRPFLKSLVVAHPFDVEALCQQAEKHAFALLWPWARGNSRGNSIGTTDTFEALAAVQREFNIDEDRIYLEGTCEGGSEALLLAARFPHRFAAVAAIAPITDETRMGDSVAGRPNTPPRLDRWRRLNSPIALAANLSNMPLVILHGQYDAMVPLSQSTAFVEECQRTGLQPHFVILPNTGHSYAPVEPIGLVMDFFKGRSRVRSPGRVVLRTSSTKYGSAYWVKAIKIDEPLLLAHLEATRKKEGFFEVNARNVEAFDLDLQEAGIVKGDNVTVVTNGALSFKGVSRSRVLPITLNRKRLADGPTKCCGLDGSIDQAVGAKFAFVDPGHAGREVEWVRRMLGTFWQEEYFVDVPRIPLGRDSLPSTCAANAVVVLSPQGGSLRSINRIEGIPIKVERNRILLGDKTYTGDDLAFQMVYPHPRCPGRYVVVMGTTAATSQRRPRFYSPAGAWYDFIVWRGGDTKGDPIIDVGFFDARWTKLISVKDEVH